MSDLVLQATIHEDPIPLEWEVANIDRERITIVLAKQMDGSTKYKVMKMGMCLSRTLDWDYESMPSSRTDDYLERHRFDNFSMAWRMATEAAKAFVVVMQEKVDFLNKQARDG